MASQTTSNTINNNGLMGLVQQFQQFKQTFTGDPRQQVQQLLNSGRVTQEQYNNAVQMANALQNVLK
jgi:hypothetical protein